MPIPRSKIETLALKPYPASGGDVGRILGNRYRLVAQIGAGASARVFVADDLSLGRRVAVKCLRSGLSDDARFIKRFRAEATAAAQLSHPNLLAVYDWDESIGSAYIVTEVLLGGSLLDLIDRQPLSLSQGLLVALQVAQGLKYAHSIGWVHRDIKPANLLFGQEGRLRIADFGIARAVAEAAWTEPEGILVGTARYAAPEQAEGDAIDEKADVYSLALTIIEAVTGDVPLLGENALATMVLRQDRDVDGFEELGALGVALADAGRADREARPTAAQLIERLTRTARSLPRPQRLSLASGPARFIHPTGEPETNSSDVGAGGGVATTGEVDLRGERGHDPAPTGEPGFDRADVDLGAGSAANPRSDLEGHELRPGDQIKSRPIPLPAGARPSRNSSAVVEQIVAGHGPSSVTAERAAIEIDTETQATPESDGEGLAHETANAHETEPVSGIDLTVGAGAGVELIADEPEPEPDAEISASSWLDQSKLEGSGQVDASSEAGRRPVGGLTNKVPSVFDKAVTDTFASNTDSTRRTLEPEFDDEPSLDVPIEASHPLPGGSPDQHPGLQGPEQAGPNRQRPKRDWSAVADGLIPSILDSAGKRGAGLRPRITGREIPPDVAANLRNEIKQRRSRRREREPELPRPVQLTRLIEEDPRGRTPATSTDDVPPIPDAFPSSAPDTAASAPDHETLAVASNLEMPVGGSAMDLLPDRVHTELGGASTDEAPPMAGLYDDQPQRQSWVAMTVLIAMILLVIGVVAAIALQSDRSTEAGAPATTELTVPTTVVAGNYLGRPVSAAEADAERFNWGLVIREERRAGTEAGDIVEQEPPSGSALADGERLSIVVSLGPDLRTVPSVIGRSIEESTAALERTDLEVRDIIEVEADEEEGQVIALEIDGSVLRSGPDSELEAGTAIDLVVSGGPSAKPMPSYVGLTVSQAIDQANSLGMELRQDQAYSERYEAGYVVHTEPPTDTPVKPGDVVTIVVSQGAPFATVPNVVGMGPEEAIAELTAAGFRVAGAAEVSDGPVRATEPAAGESHRKGASITIISLW